MTPPILGTLKRPLAIRPEYVAPQPTTLRIKQSSASWSRGDFIVFREDESLPGYDEAESSKASSSETEPERSRERPGETRTSGANKESLFSVEGRAFSMTKKRVVRDASGLPLFDVYQKLLSTTWLVQLPGETGDTPLARLSRDAPLGALKTKFDLTVYPHGREAVELHVQEEDMWKLRTNVFMGSKAIMTAKRTDKKTAYIPVKGFEWVVDVAEGMDTSLVSETDL